MKQPQNVDTTTSIFFFFASFLALIYTTTTTTFFSPPSCYAFQQQPLSSSSSSSSSRIGHLFHKRSKNPPLHLLLPSPPQAIVGRKRYHHHHHQKRNFFLFRRFSSEDEEEEEDSTSENQQIDADGVGVAYQNDDTSRREFDDDDSDDDPNNDDLLLYYYQEFLKERRRKELLQQTDLFQDLSIGDQAKLAAMIVTVDDHSFSSEDDGDKQSSSSSSPSSNPIIVKQGKPCHSMYIISKGEFECYTTTTSNDVDNNGQQQQEEQVLFVLSEGQYFGELELLYNKNAAAASIRPISDEWQLFEISRQVFEDIITQKVRPSLLQTVENESTDYYSPYFEKNSKLDALKKCRLFNKISSEDCERIANAMICEQVQPGTVLLKQGQVDSTECMYFVKSGIFEVYQEVSTNNGGGGNIKLLGTRKAGDFFGELALLLQQPRAASVRAAATTTTSAPASSSTSATAATVAVVNGDHHQKNDDDDNKKKPQQQQLVAEAEAEAEVWVLNKDDFLEAVQNSPVYESTIAYLKEKYQVNSIWSLVAKLSPSQIYELAVANSRPKREPVSSHSILSTITFGLLMAVYINTWNPGFYYHDEAATTNNLLLLPRFYDFQNQYTLGIWYTKIITYLFGLIAITGILRLPPITPQLRRLMFQQCAVQCILNVILQDSNLVVLPPDEPYFSYYHTFDFATFNLLTIGAFGITLTAKIWYGSQFVIESIAAPEKGRRLIPFNGNPFALSVLAAFAYIGPYIQIPKFCFGGPNTEAYNQYYLPYLQESFGAVTSYIAMSSAVLGIGMLYATLYSERKLSNQQLVWMIPASVVVFGAYDAAFQAADLTKPDASQLFHEYYDMINQTIHFYPFIFGSYFALVMAGIAIRFKRRQPSVEE